MELSEAGPGTRHGPGGKPAAPGLTNSLPSMPRMAHNVGLGGECHPGMGWGWGGICDDHDEGNKWNTAGTRHRPPRPVGRCGTGGRAGGQAGGHSRSVYPSGKSFRATRNITVAFLYRRQDLCARLGTSTLNVKRAGNLVGAFKVWGEATWKEESKEPEFSRPVQGPMTGMRVAGHTM